MSAINQIASRLLGGRRGGARRPTATPRPTGTSRPTGTTGNSTDAAIGRGVRGVLGKLRR